MLNQLSPEQIASLAKKVESLVALTALPNGVSRDDPAAGQVIIEQDEEELSNRLGLLQVQQEILQELVSTIIEFV